MEKMEEKLVDSRNEIEKSEGKCHVKKKKK